MSTTIKLASDQIQDSAIIAAHMSAAAKQAALQSKLVASWLLSGLQANPAADNLDITADLTDFNFTVTAGVQGDGVTKGIPVLLEAASATGAYEYDTTGGTPSSTSSHVPHRCAVLDENFDEMLDANGDEVWAVISAAARDTTGPYKARFFTGTWASPTAASVNNAGGIYLVWPKIVDLDDMNLSVLGLPFVSVNAQAAGLAAGQITTALLADLGVTEAKLAAAVKLRAVECQAPVDVNGAVVRSTGNEGLVEALATPGMAVRVQTAGTGYNELGARITVPTTTSLAIAAADPTNPRYDVIVCSSAGALAVRQGTPGASPSEPGLTAGDVKLAVVDVAALVTVINAADIYDHRRSTVPVLRTENAQGDGSTTAFDLARHVWGTVAVYRNGQRLREVAASPATVDEYTVTKMATEASGTRITFGAAPAATPDQLDFDYCA